MTLREDLQQLNEAELTFIASHLLEEIEGGEGYEPSSGGSPEEQFRLEASYLQGVVEHSGGTGTDAVLGKKEAAIDLLTTLAEASPELEASLRRAMAERHEAGKQLFDPVTGLAFVMVAIAFAIVRPSLRYERDRTKTGERTTFSFKMEGTKQLDKVIEAVGKLMPSVFPRASDTTVLPGGGAVTPS